MLVQIQPAGDPMKFDRPRRGELVNPVQTGYRMECCDCGLVHSADFIVVSDLGLWPSWFINLLRPRAMFRMTRDQKATAERRALRNTACQMNEF